MHITYVLLRQLVHRCMAAVCRYGLRWGCACIINIDLAAVSAAGSVHQVLQGGKICMPKNICTLDQAC